MSSEIKVDTISENTSANGVVIDSVTLKDGGIAATAATTITTADNTDTLTLTSTDADASVGPALRLYRNSASPADDDELAKIRFDGKNSAGEDVTYGYIQVQPSDVTDGTEDGFMQLQTMVAGSSRGRVSMYSYATVMNEHSQDIDFRVESNDNTHMFFVDALTNKIGIGDFTSAPGQVLHVEAEKNNDIVVKLANSHSTQPYVAQLRFTGAATDNNTQYFLACVDTSTTRLVIKADGDIQNHDNSYGAISDERIKQDIRDSNSQWDDIKAVKVRNYKKKDDVRQYGDKAWEQIGVVAQELESAGMDKLVKESDPTPSDVLSDASFGTLYEDGDTIPDGKEIGDVKEVKATVKGVSYSVLYMKAIKALQEAMARIETLEAEVTALKGE